MQSVSTESDDVIAVDDERSDTEVASGFSARISLAQYFGDTRQRALFETTVIQNALIGDAVIYDRELFVREGTDGSRTPVFEKAVIPQVVDYFIGRGAPAGTLRGACKSVAAWSALAKHPPVSSVEDFIAFHKDRFASWRLAKVQELVVDSDLYETALGTQFNQCGRCGVQRAPIYGWGLLEHIMLKFSRVRVVRGCQ